jgi:hypothetical protein
LSPKDWGSFELSIFCRSLRFFALARRKYLSTRDFAVLGVLQRFSFISVVLSPFQLFGFLKKTMFNPRIRMTRCSVLCIVTAWFVTLPSYTLAGFWDNTPTTRDEDPPERQYLDEVIRPDGTVEYGVDIVRINLLLIAYFCGYHGW